MENNKITLPGKIDVSQVDGGQQVFIINLTYDSTNSRINDNLFLFLPDKNAEEIESAINNDNIVVYLQYPFVQQIFNIMSVGPQLVYIIDDMGNSSLIWDIDYVHSYTLAWNYDSEVSEPESTNSFNLYPAASFDVETISSNYETINHDYVIGNIYYDYGSKKITATEYELNINENSVESQPSSNKAYLLGHETFGDLSPAVINSGAYMQNGKLYSNSTEVATQTDVSNKVSSTTITAIQVVSSMPASPDSNTLYIVQ